MSEKFTHADIAKTIEGTGIGRVNAAAIALSIVKSMADALAAGKAIELRASGPWNKERAKGAQCTIPGLWQRWMFPTAGEFFSGLQRN
jgi:hypothetical protein